MKVRIVRIGNSRGVRIPKLLLERCKLVDEVEIEAEEGRIILRSPRGPRQGWAESFQLMADHGDDELLDNSPFVQTKWEDNEWEW